MCTRLPLSLPQRAHRQAQSVKPLRRAAPRHCAPIVAANAAIGESAHRSRCRHDEAGPLQEALPTIRPGRQAAAFQRLEGLRSWRSENGRIAVTIRWIRYRSKGLLEILSALSTIRIRVVSGCVATSAPVDRLS